MDCPRTSDMSKIRTKTQKPSKTPLERFTCYVYLRTCLDIDCTLEYLLILEPPQILLGVLSVSHPSYLLYAIGLACSCGSMYIT